MRRHLLCSSIALVVALALVGCTKSSQSPNAPSSPQVTASTEATATSPSAVGAAASPGAASATAGGAAASPLASGTTGQATGGQVSFTDIQGIFAEQQIKDLAQLGVFDVTAGAFSPDGTVKRGEFARWLVKANNALYSDSPGKQIRPAEGTEQAFLDVPPSHPDYKFVQALANAGFVVGVDEKHFAPDQTLTREEMIAIKVPVDLGGDPYKNTGLADVRAAFPFSDDEKISTRYYDAIYGDNFDGSKNITRVFGQMRTFQPQRPVTRSEAALCISTVGNYSPRNTTGALARPTQ